ncbi:MAG: sulfotransferase [Planctomycetota bacterium]
MASPTQQALRQWLSGVALVDAMDKVFVVGCPKSGTTWAMNLIDGHPNAVVRGEGKHGWVLLPLLEQLAQAYNGHGWDPDPVTRIDTGDIQALARTHIDAAMLKYLQNAGEKGANATVVGDKTPQNAVRMHELAVLFPEAKFVHVVRNPLDAAWSAWHHLGPQDGRPLAAYVRHFLAEVWPANVRAAQQACRALGETRAREVRYEDLHRDPGGQTRALLEFLGLDARPEHLDACLAHADFTTRSGGRAPGDEDPAHAYRKGVVGDGADHLPAEAVAQCLPAIEPLMRHYGYAHEPAAVA